MMKATQKNIILVKVNAKETKIKSNKKNENTSRENQTLE